MFACVCVCVCVCVNRATLLEKEVTCIEGESKCLRVCVRMCVRVCVVRMYLCTGRMAHHNLDIICSTTTQLHFH
jgi:hypothetical protein